MKKITFISDTHTLHKKLTGDLIGGDIIIHSGDISSMGYEHEIREFCKWFSKLDYTHKIFIAGNHDWGFQDNKEKVSEIVNSYEGITYLEDSEIIIDGIKIYGSPWQPEFCNWAFNLARGEAIKNKWDLIPIDTDILITHGPPKGILDYVSQSKFNAGCEELYKRVFEVKPKINVFGHIHQSYGNKTIDDIEFINASVLDERYYCSNKPINIEFDITNNFINYIN